MMRVNVAPSLSLVVISQNPDTCFWIPAKTWFGFEGLGSLIHVLVSPPSKAVIKANSRGLFAEGRCCCYCFTRKPLAKIVENHAIDAKKPMQPRKIETSSARNSLGAGQKTNFQDPILKALSIPRV